MSRRYKNSFFLSRFYYCYLIQELILKRDAKILDVGCGDGYCIGNMRNVSSKLFGYDVDNEKVKIAKRKYPYVSFHSGRPGEDLPYKKNSFDIVFLFHVLEHVDSEERIINEISRVLKSGGVLYLASPYKGLFAWADTANLRYRLPFFHKFFASLYYGEEKYNELFDSPAKEMFGDSSLGRDEHKHYKREEIKILLSRAFTIEAFITYSLFQPLLLILDNLFIMIFRKQPHFMDWLVWWDNKINAYGWSNNMVVVAKKYAK